LNPLLMKASFTQLFSYCLTTSIIISRAFTSWLSDSPSSSTSFQGQISKGLVFVHLHK